MKGSLKACLAPERLLNKARAKSHDPLDYPASLNCLDLPFPLRLIFVL